MFKNEVPSIMVSDGRRPPAVRDYHPAYYLVSGIDYTFGQKEGCNEDCIQADVG